MVHAFCPINDVTIKSNYPMKRIEPILNSLSSLKFKIFWFADGANGYWAVPMWKPHAFKTAFSTVLGQFAYVRMGQGLSGAPHTYAQLKNLARGTSLNRTLRTASLGTGRMVPSTPSLMMTWALIQCLRIR